MDELTEEEISKRLGVGASPSFDVATSYLQQEMLKAAVLIPFVRKQDSWHLLFIRRSQAENDMHSGQVAFAGGKHEEFDKNLDVTALRETQEEIGILGHDITILGRLSHHYTISQFQVTPVVATIPWPYQLKLDAHEVAHAFTIPLNWLADPANYKVRYRRLNKNKEPVPVVYFDEYKGELLWGATARITLSLINQLQRE